MNIESAAEIEVGVGKFFFEKIQKEKIKVKVTTGGVKIDHFTGILDIETGVGSISCKDVQAEKLNAKIKVGDVIFFRFILRPFAMPFVMVVFPLPSSPWRHSMSPFFSLRAILAP